MKKTLSMGLLVLLLAACSSTGSTDSGTTTTGGSTGTAAVSTDSGEVTASVTKEDGKITNVSIDEIQDNSSKKDAGNDYGMKEASGIKKEWFEQIEFLEKYIEENGVDAVKLDADGYAEGDLATGCTINLSTIMKAVDEAAAKAE